MNIKRILAATTIPFIILLSSGCGGSDAPKADVTHTSKPAPFSTETPDLSDDTKYDIIVELTAKEYPEISSSQVRQIAEAVCPYFESGGTLTEYAGLAEDEGFDLDAAGYIAGATVQAFCPEYLDEITGKNLTKDS